jgi:hypothetical protein
MKLNPLKPADTFSGANIGDIAAPQNILSQAEKHEVTPESLKQLFQERGYLKLGEASVLRKFQIKESLTRNASNIFTFGTIGMGLTALASRIFSSNPDSESSIAHSLELWAKRATSATLATYALIAGNKAIQNKDAALGVSQLSEMIVPMMSSTENLTVNRGFGIALNTIAIEAKKFFNGHKFDSFGHSVDALKGALKEVSRRFADNPLSTLMDFKNGPGTILASAPVLIAPLLKLVGVNDKLVYMARAIPGAALEFGKVTGSLKRGAPLYFASGVNMMISSALNLVGGFMPSARKSLEMLTWSFNLLGRLLLVRSIKNDEIKSSNNQPVTISELPKIVLGELFAKTDLEKIPPVLNLSMKEDANKPFEQAARNAARRHYEAEEAKSGFFHSRPKFNTVSKPSTVSSEAPVKEASTQPTKPVAERKTIVTSIPELTMGSIPRGVKVGNISELKRGSSNENKLGSVTRTNHTSKAEIASPSTAPKIKKVI